MKAYEKFFFQNKLHESKYLRFQVLAPYKRGAAVQTGPRRFISINNYLQIMLDMIV